MDIKGNRFLVTGGTSLTGARIAEVLLSKGASHVTLLDNFSLSEPVGIDQLTGRDDVTLVKGDVLRLDQLAHAAKACTGIFGIAGYLTVALSKDPKLGIEVNTIGAYNTLEAARLVGAKKVIYASSIGVYGSAIGNKTSESTGLSVDGIAEPRALYALSKLAAEQLGSFYSRNHGIDFAAMRYASVYGERQHDRGMNVLNIVKAYESIRRGVAPQFTGTGLDSHDLIYVGDAARASVMAMESENARGPYNIGSGQTTSVREMVAKVVEITGTTLVPRFKTSESTATASTHGTHQWDMSVSIDKAWKDFGWRPEVGVDEGVKRLLNWLEEDQNAKSTTK